MKLYRQGDVLIKKISDLPKNSIKQELEGDIILALGEVTGHAHRIKDGADWWKNEEVMILEVSNKASITHEEHHTIDLEAGFYEVRRQREYSPEEIRNVAD